MVSDLARLLPLSLSIAPPSNSPRALPRRLERVHRAPGPARTHSTGEAATAAVADGSEGPPGLEPFPVEDARGGKGLEVAVAAAGGGLGGASSHASHGVGTMFLPLSSEADGGERGGGKEGKKEKSLMPNLFVFPFKGKNGKRRQGREE